MLKKLTFSTILVFTLNACTTVPYNTYTPAEPAYKISEEDMKRAVLEQNNFEQCIRPELKGLSYEQAKAKVYDRQSELERTVWTIFASKRLKNIIGQSNFETFWSDNTSRQYFENLYQKLNNQIANVNQKECNVLKKEYKSEVARVKKILQENKKRELAAQRQREKEERARQAFFTSPQGQAYLAQQRLIAQQQALLQQQQIAAQQATQSQNSLGDFFSTISNAANSVAQSQQNLANGYQQATMSIKSAVPSFSTTPTTIGRSGSSTCYRLAGNMVRCNHQ